MREICTSGLEGGASQPMGRPYPYQCACQERTTSVVLSFSPEGLVDRWELHCGLDMIETYPMNES